MQPRIAPNPSCRFGLHARTVWKPARKHDLFQYGHCPRCLAAAFREIGAARVPCWAFGLVAVAVLLWWVS